jgi:hypothetical protein
VADLSLNGAILSLILRLIAAVPLRYRAVPFVVNSANSAMNQ